MSKSRTAATVAAALTLATAGSAAAAATAEVGATHGLIKIQPTDQVTTQKVARIGAAANEIETFQAVVQGGAQGVSGVSAKMSDLKGPATISADNVVLYRAEYMNIRNLSDSNARGGRTPDALIPDVDPYVGEKRNAFPFDVPAGENRTVWVDVHVPSGTPAGTYEGTLELAGAGGFSQTLPVEVEVFPFELSSTPSYASSFGMAWNGTCSAHHGEAWCSGDDQKFDELRALYGIAGLNNRISFSSVVGAPVPGSNGNLDFSRYDRVYGPLLDGTANTRLEGAQLTSVEVWQKNPQAADYAAWAKHFKDKGWYDKLFDYTCDEPPLTCEWSDIKPRQDRVHAGDPDFKSLVTTTVGHLKDRGLYESTDIIVPVVNFVEGKEGDYAGDQSAIYRQAQAEGKTIWIYSSCMSHGCGGTVGGEYEDPALKGWPSLVMDHTALQNRAMPWVAYKYGFTGELYWDSVYSFVTKSDVWTDQWDFSGNGDGTLFYPGTPAKIGGTTHIPVESIRMKQIRDGVEDYDYLKTLETFDPKAAKAFADKLFPHAWSAGDIAPEQLLETRREIAHAIAKHTGGSGGKDTNQPIVGGGNNHAGTDGGSKGSSSGGGGGGGCSTTGAPAAASSILMGLGVTLGVIRRRK